MLSEHSCTSLSETLLFFVFCFFLFWNLLGAGFRDSGLMVLYTRAKNDMDENIALPEGDFIDIYIFFTIIYLLVNSFF